MCASVILRYIATDEPWAVPCGIGVHYFELYTVRSCHPAGTVDTTQQGDAPRPTACALVADEPREKHRIEGPGCFVDAGALLGPRL